MKTREPSLSSEGRDKAEGNEKPMQRFKRGAMVVMTASRSKVKALEALEARQRRKAKKAKPKD